MTAVESLRLQPNDVLTMLNESLWMCHRQIHLTDELGYMFGPVDVRTVSHGRVVPLGLSILLVGHLRQNEKSSTQQLCQ